jgi:hypothetical protein
MKPQPLNPTDQHMQVQELLLRHAAGSLTPEQYTLVRRHLEVCTECREDAALGLQLAAADPAMPPGLDPERALARLMPRLDAMPEAPREAPQGATQAASRETGAAAEQDAFRTRPAAGAAHPQRAPRPSRTAALLQGLRDALAGGGWRNWALAAQCVVIAGLAVLWQSAPQPEYRVLGSGAAATPDVVVVFKPDTSIGQVRQLLQATGARIVGGPTVTGAYLLDVDTAQASTLLAALRADPAVQLAEPLNGAAPAAGARP